MALSAAADWKTSPGHLLEVQVEAGTTIYHGALVGVGTTASATSQTLVTNWLGTNEDLKFLGVAVVTETSQDETDNAVVGVTHTTPASGPNLTTIGVDISGLVLREVTLGAGTLVSTEQIGTLVFASDENTFTTVADVAGPIGFVSKIYSGTVVDIKLFTPGEHMANTNAAVWSAT